MILRTWPHGKLLQEFLSIKLLSSVWLMGTRKRNKKLAVFLKLDAFWTFLNEYIEDTTFVFVREKRLPCGQILTQGTLITSPETTVWQVRYSNSRLRDKYQRHQRSHRNSNRSYWMCWNRGRVTRLLRSSPFGAKIEQTQNCWIDKQDKIKAQMMGSKTRWFKYKTLY